MPNSHHQISTCTHSEKIKKIQSERSGNQQLVWITTRVMTNEMIIGLCGGGSITPLFFFCLTTTKNLQTPPR